MPLTLERIVYVSRATTQAHSLLGIAEIIGQAKTNNDRRDITGALALGDSHFLQVLEGRRHELDALLNRLGEDPRHSDLEVLGRRPIEARIFSGWAMKGPLSSDAVRRLVADAKSRHLTAEESAASLAIL